MPYTHKTETNTKLRILISGGPNTGKSTSLDQFITTTGYILNCPGEKGTASLPTSDDRVEVFVYENETSEKEEYQVPSNEMVEDFTKLTFSIIYGKLPQRDVLCLDGIHKLYPQWMDALTSGAFLRGEDILDGQGRDVGGKFYGKTHNMFDGFLSRIYSSKIPLIVMTTWEEWENRDENLNLAQQRSAIKHLYPMFPGKMAKLSLGNFDAVISARLENRCAIKGCEYTEEGEDHHVWQIAPKGDVRGVGLKGVTLPPALAKTPFIHQDWATLKRLLKYAR